MNVSDIPADYTGFEELLEAYEANHSRTPPPPRPWWQPRAAYLPAICPDGLKAPSGPVADSLLLPELRTAVGAPTPTLPVRMLIGGMIRLRATAEAWKAPRTEPSSPLARHRVIRTAIGWRNSGPVREG